jgi:bifunctional non-homologous end joining protein LigD
MKWKRKSRSTDRPGEIGLGYWRDGDLRKLPQIERKQLLLDLLGENDIELPVQFSEHLIGDGQKMFEHAARLN